MKMFTPSGDEVLVDKGQVDALKKAGWSFDAPEATESDESADAAATAEEKTPVRKKRIVKPKG